MIEKYHGLAGLQHPLCTTMEIGIDCPPGGPRPGELLPEVLMGTGITVGEPTVKFFGFWRWTITEEQREIYNKARETIKNRLTNLYERGHIRYAEW